MIDYKSMIENENIEDILLFLAPKVAYHAIDNWFVRYRFEIVANCTLLRTCNRLVVDGKLSENDKGHIIKGPNWKAPAFVIEKKYGIE